MRLLERAPWSGRDGHAALTHNGAIFLMGGTQDPRNNFSDVWRSVNGRDWVQVETRWRVPRPWESARSTFAWGSFSIRCLLEACRSKRMICLYTSVDGKVVRLYTSVRRTGDAAHDARQTCTFFTTSTFLPPDPKRYFYRHPPYTFDFQTCSFLIFLFVLEIWTAF